MCRQCFCVRIIVKVEFRRQGENDAPVRRKTGTCAQRWVAPQNTFASNLRTGPLNALQRTAGPWARVLPASRCDRACPVTGRLRAELTAAAMAHPQLSRSTTATKRCRAATYVPKSLPPDLIRCGWSWSSIILHHFGSTPADQPAGSTSLNIEGSQPFDLGDAGRRVPRAGREPCVLHGSCAVRARPSARSACALTNERF